MSFSFSLKNVLISIFFYISLGCKAWRRTGLHCGEKESAISKASLSGTLGVAAVCHSSEDRFTGNDRRHHLPTRTARLWKTVDVSSVFASDCEYQICCFYFLLTIFDEHVNLLIWSSFYCAICINYNLQFSFVFVCSSDMLSLWKYGNDDHLWS